MKKKILFAVLTVLLAFSGVVFAQYMYAVDGYVYDAYTDEPIVGATVKIKGITAATVTDIDGYFRILGNFIGKTLVVDYVGYQQAKEMVTPTRQYFAKIVLIPDEVEE